jgi:hypothetical protein
METEINIMEIQMINMEKERESVNDLLWDNTPADKLAAIFDVWINEEFKHWFNYTLEGSDEDKRWYLNILATEEMDFMLERFQDTLEECINQYGKEVIGCFLDGLK